METSIGSFEAKTHFSQLIERVSRGEEIMITRRGKPVAKLVPATPSRFSESAPKAAHTLRHLAQKMDMGVFEWGEWKALRDQGRA